VSPPAVIVDNVSKRFRLYHERNQSLKAAVMRGRRAVVEEFWALKDVSFEVQPGTTFGLIGENGSGKSTLLKCLARILRPDAGSVRVNGKVSALLELGAGFHPELSGRENVFLNGAILGLSQKELGRKFDEIVEFAGLGQFIDQPVKNYSSGMYVRLGFSVAINVDPDVLFVDEVLAVGDEAFQRKCNEKFAELREAGKTIVLVSHTMGAINNLCDDVAWLEHGRIKMLAPAHEVVDEYVGNVQMDRQADEGGHMRWGSGEGRIDKIEILDRSGQSVTKVRTGEAMTIRLHYDIDQPIERPIFGLAIHTVEGLEVTGPNTREANQIPDVLDGRGHVDFTVDRLLLLQGTFDITASLYDYSLLHAFDFRHRALRFDVDPGVPREAHGVVSLDGAWRVSEPAKRV
jgi:ABC-2 type transport system ATP-binding protein